MTSFPVIFDRRLVRWRRTRSLRVKERPTFLDDVVRDELYDRLKSVKRIFRRIVLHASPDTDFGMSLRKLYPTAQILQTDSVETSLATVVFDDEALPFPDQSLDVFVYVSGLEFVNDTPGVLRQIKNALTPDGLFIGAALGGNTLHELKAAWLACEASLNEGASPRIAPLVDVREWGGLLQRAGFALPVVDRDRLTVRYANALELMRDLRALGLANSLKARSRRVVTQHLLERVAEHYAVNNADPDGRIRATFEMIYLTGWSPHHSQQKPLQPGSARQRLSDALNVKEQKLKRD